PRVAHDHLIAPVDRYSGIDQPSLPSPHELCDVMRRILQPPRLQSLAERLAEQEAAVRIGIVDGEEDGVALEAVVEVMLLALVLPRLQKRVRHRVMVN